MIGTVRALKRGDQCRDQIFYSVGYRLEKHSVGCRLGMINLSLVSVTIHDGRIQIFKAWLVTDILTHVMRNNIGIPITKNASDCCQKVYTSLYRPAS